MMDKQKNLAAVSEGPREPTGELKHLQQQIAELTEQVTLISTSSRLKDVPHCFSQAIPTPVSLLYPQCHNQQHRCYNCDILDRIERECRSSHWERFWEFCDGHQTSPNIGYSDTIIVAIVHTRTSVINAHIGGILMLDSGSTISLLRHDVMVSQTSNPLSLPLPSKCLVTASGQPLKVGCVSLPV